VQGEYEKNDELCKMMGLEYEWRCYLDFPQSLLTTLDRISPSQEAKPKFWLRFSDQNISKFILMQIIAACSMAQKFEVQL